MNQWVFLSPAEKTRRIVSITALLTAMFCAVYFFKVWFLTLMKVMYQPVVLIPLGVVIWIVIIYQSVRWLRNRL